MAMLQLHYRSLTALLRARIVTRIVTLLRNDPFAIGSCMVGCFMSCLGLLDHVLGVLEAHGVDGWVASLGGVGVRNCTSRFKTTFSGLQGA
ncbi:putative leucine-rich repeat-containing protein [Fusarium oxysporum f. sp. albedinis]|nr:putative leucine-rich repeat-containing protein [Fusarium oxysporum f. sp. albedinis]